MQSCDRLVSVSIRFIEVSVLLADCIKNLEHSNTVCALYIHTFTINE